MSGLLIKHKAGNDISINCFGEVLWDCFDTGKRIGGAPLNVCLRLNGLGIQANIISAVGDDKLGKELLQQIEVRNTNTDFIAVNANKKTSTVEVKLDQSGSASYEILADTAWDNIPLTVALLEQVSSSDIFVFGSLVGRQQVSLDTLRKLLKVANYKIFDVNLRKPHYNLKTLVEMMNKADFIKLNDDELYEIAQGMGSEYNSLEQNLEFVANQTNTQKICVTKGSHGALLRFDDVNYYNSGYLVKVVDTVGAGDSFLASLIYQLCHTNNPQYAIDFACAVGAMVAQHKGATPEISILEIQQFMDPVKTT
ncbi:carbohydrate kinase family protein [Paraglaciecola arctica]|uniref:carbohydrate kinase family protein n=1 Tax=Paraglaciecola arctica TaxID=1128911 RepID=UPI001C07B642|nr:carbohydrate kinase [Paraglaciecola arctica]MBU3003019.1 carbohydrate kinase [Paraglaciecola arctica]